MNMQFVIRNSPETSGQPLYFTGTDAVGILRANEAKFFDTEESAMSFIVANKMPAPRLYNWVVVPATWAAMGIPDPRVGSNGWMIGHPGYDLH